MKIIEKVKLSELPDGTLLSYEGATIQLTAAELLVDVESYKGFTWYVCTGSTWKPSAKRMVDSYIEGEYDNMYEDWDKRAFDCLRPEHYERIQAVLDEAFKSDHATKYWMLDGPEVEIDISTESNE